MTPPDGRRPSGRVPMALLALLVVGISAAIVQWRAPRESWADPPRYAGGAPLRQLASVLPEPRLPAGLRVAVLRDTASDRFYGGSGRLDTLTSAWSEQLRALGATVVVAMPESLAAAGAIDVIVVPSMPCIGAATYDALAGAGRMERGVVLTRFTGRRDAGCVSMGAGLVTSMTGAARVDTIEQRAETYVVFPGGGALSTGIPPGARLEVLAGNHVALRASGRDAYWGDYDLHPVPAGGQPLLDAAVAHSAARGARTVYWGFELTDVADRAWSRDLLALLLRNSIAWAAGRPMAELESWPDGRRAAAVIAQDVEDQFANARHALDTLRAADVRGTFFLVSELAREHEELVRELAAAGEIGTHSENHRLLGGLDAALQQRRLEETQDHLTRLTGQPVAGLRPPEEQFDGATLRGWRAAGGSYVFATNDGRTASPELLRIADDTVVLLGRIAYDDFAVVRRAGLTAPDTQASIYLREFRKARALGGLFMFSYHSNMLARPEFVGALGPLVRTIARDSATWLATAGEVAAWWRARANVGVESRAVGIDGVDLTLINTGAYQVERAIARIVLGSERTAMAVSRGVLLDAEPGVVRIALPALPAGDTLRVHVRLRPRGG